ncbi:MAG: flagellar assembly protein FliH [Gammaproteobacteria bacterium]|nr:flagellar assembly protein FliH [Gammaproteobacteria bacterium]
MSNGSKSNVISKEKASQAKIWNTPEVGLHPSAGCNVLGGGAAPLPTAAKIDEWRKQAQQEGHQEGFEKGRQEGLQKGLEQARQTQQLLQTMVNTFSAPFKELDAALDEQIMSLAVTLAQQIVRREIRLDPGQIIPLIRETVLLLPAGSNLVKIHCHPEDAKLVREALSLDEEAQTWKLIDDPAIARGGCKVISEFSRIDASLEKQLNALTVAALGSEREMQRDELSVNEEQTE